MAGRTETPGAYRVGTCRWFRSFSWGCGARAFDGVTHFRAPNLLPFHPNFKGTPNGAPQYLITTFER